jgi:TolA-binding protein
MSQNYKDANEQLDMLIAEYGDRPDFPGTLYWITERYERMGNFEEAGRNYQRIIDNYPEGIYTTHSKLGISTIDVISLIQSKDYNEADAVLDKLIEDFNGSPRLPHSVSLIAEQYYNLAEKETDDANRQDEYWRAVGVWDRIINELPPSGYQTANAHFWTGDCFRKMGDCNKAIEHFQNAVDKWPNYQFGWSAYCLIGECYEKLLDSNAITREAAEPNIEQAYKAVIEKYPDCSLAGHCRIKLGWHNFRKQNWKEAADYFESYLNSVDKPENDPREVSVLFGLGMTYQQMGDIESAKQAYWMFLEKAPPTNQQINNVRRQLELLEKGIVSPRMGSTGSPQVGSKCSIKGE